MEANQTIRKNAKKTFQGKVVSVKRDKTATVIVDTYIKHPLYHKRFKKSKKFSVHDETNEASLGDIVKISETRPISKTKKFRISQIVEKGREGVK
ncbi:30S ribosomal protein S17 [[Mycoplasma] collis]|uniref:30S ribosomal protein S17 n=1 Tax=[Mycoplasma] collis TaxID=2127 RepID=UPI00051B1BE1|nr:30S ribosomal protein S17 [[Mycoplasma] collis]